MVAAISESAEELVNEDADPRRCREQHAAHLRTLAGGGRSADQAFARWLRQNDVVFAGEPIPHVLAPYFVSSSDVATTAQRVEVLAGALDRFCAAYCDDERLCAELALPEHEDALVRIDPGFARPMRLCRLDAFTAGEDLRFLEFNAESPAGIGYADMLVAGMNELGLLDAVREHFELSYEALAPQLLAMLRATYDDWAATHPGRKQVASPKIAIVDIAATPSIPEFRILCSLGERLGYDLCFGSFEELRFTGDTLALRDAPIDLVYRRALVEDLLDPSAATAHTSGANALIDAVRAGVVAMVNPFRARIANNKKVLALLEDPRFAYLLDDEAREVVATTIPWTRILRAGSVTTGPHTGAAERNEIDLCAYASAHRKELVLKPASDYGGHNVALGPATNQQIWDSLIETHAGSGDWIVQQYLPVPLARFPSAESGKIIMQRKHFNLNPFTFAGQYAGSITRISDRAVINVSAGGGLMPNVTVRSQRHKEHR